MTSSLLPSHATDLERALADVLGDAASVPVPIADLWRPDTIPSTHLPYLAWALSVDDEWQFARTDAERRALTAAAVELHRTKGTPHAVRRGMQLLGFRDAEIVEGLDAVRHDGEITRSGSHAFAGASRWALFRVVADLGATEGLDAAQMMRIVGIINAYKNARSHLYALSFRANIADSVDTDPAFLAPLSVGLRLGTRRGVRDGRFARGSQRRHARTGEITYAGTSTRADRVVTETIRYHQGNLIVRAPLRLALHQVDARPAHLPRDGRARFDGRVRRGRPLATIVPTAPVVTRRIPRDGSHDRRGWGPRRDGSHTYAGTVRRGARHVHGATVHTLEAA